MNKKFLDVSIIIPFYNRHELLIETINSFIRQINKNFEIILINDGGEDIDYKKLFKFNNIKIKYLKLKSNNERAFSRNYGVQFAKGKYINFFDSDDLAMNNHISTASDIISKFHPEIFHLSYSIKKTNSKNIKNFIIEGIQNNKILKNNNLSCNGIFIRRNIVINYKFNENRLLSGSEDWELWLRLSKLFKIISYPKITSTIIDHNTRSMRNINIKLLEKRISTFISIINQNDSFTKNEKLKINSELIMYKTLHQSFNKDMKNIVLKNLIIAFRYNFYIIFNKKIIVIIKNLLIKQ